MVDFTKKTPHAAKRRAIEPSELYKQLDRASDKGPLRPAQTAVLDRWHGSLRAQRDVVLKMHTGEGKTLVGLLMLQSKLNEGVNRALYLCPNNYLVVQTLAEASAFGLGAVPQDEDGELPTEFLDGRAILVASVQKLFNGKTKFLLGGASLSVGAVVLDDAHACIDAIKSACEISLDRAHPGYSQLVNLFGADLEQQGAGTFAELTHDEASGSFLPVPYWAWFDRSKEVSDILVQHVESKAVKFTWPLLRDSLQDCQCIVGAKGLVIAPYRPPLEKFGSYHLAKHRVFMSATLTDDSFLLKGLGVAAASVEAPLSYSDTKWSGEKMVLLPSLIDDSLTEAEVLDVFAKEKKGRTYGVVALVPSTEASKAWKSAGAAIATKADIEEHIARLRSGESGDCDTTVVFVNRYDGIDLPDKSCRILVLDGKPFGDALLDRHLESCRPGSDVVASRIARVIEQGMGRAVRGEKDYCVVVLTRGDLVRAVRTKEGRAFLSEQTRSQIEIGLQIAQFAREEASNDSPRATLVGLVNQSLKRDEGWKAFYSEKMDEMEGGLAKPRLLKIYAAELEAELQYEKGEVQGAVDRIQALLDGLDGATDADRGWYLQEMARYQYRADKVEAAKLQKAAHQKNRLLLRPRDGVSVKRLKPIAEKRIGRVLEWMRAFEDQQAMIVAVDDIVGALRFGVRAETFEDAMHRLAAALGFEADRPDKEWKEGPDNLWGLREGAYVLFECKSEVGITRAEISKSETGQMNNSAAWFAREYPGASSTRVMIIPTLQVAPGAGFSQATVILRESGLHTLTKNVRRFFASLRKFDLGDLTESRVEKALDAHGLDVTSLQASYYEDPKARAKS